MQLDKSKAWIPLDAAAVERKVIPKRELGCKDRHGQTEERRVKTKSSVEVQLGQGEGNGDTAQDSSPEH